MTDIGGAIKNYLRIYALVIMTGAFAGPLVVFLVTQKKESFDLFGYTFLYGIFFFWIGIPLLTFIDLFIRSFKWNSLVSRSLGCALLVVIPALPITYVSDRHEPQAYLALSLYGMILGALTGFFHYQLIGIVGEEEG